MSTQMNDFNQKIIEEFRANEGRVAMFADFPMIILHTIGRKSGNTLLVPLVLTVKNDGDMLLFGSFAGAKDDPAWAHNLRANPEIDVDVGTVFFLGFLFEAGNNLLELVFGEFPVVGLEKFFDRSGFLPFG